MREPGSRFTIFPAIDLRHGHVVRLKHGDPDQVTSYHDDPGTVAKQWIGQGANWLHVINLDGAFGESGKDNRMSLSEITKLDVSVQFGGGLRSAADIDRAFDLGADRIVLGTIAIRNPTLVEKTINQYGSGKVAVAIDALSGRVKISGWQSDSRLTVFELASQLAESGLRTVIYTDIGRDGILTGLNLSASIELAKRSGLEVIASGGVADLEDVRQAKNSFNQGISGVVIGRALYENRFDLSEALAIE